MRNKMFISIGYILLFVFGLKAASKDSFDYVKPFILLNIQGRADVRTPLEYQFAYVRPKKLSFSFKYASINYNNELMDIVVYYQGNNVNASLLINAVNGNTFKLGLIYPMSYTKHTLSYVSIGGVITSIDNNLQAFNQNLYTISNTMLGSELELAGILFFAKRYHIGGLVDIGYKQMNIYKIDEIIKDYPARQTYAPAQGYSPIPFYVSVSALIGLKF